MAEHGTVFLMYHELALPGRATCHPEPGYTRYVVSASGFRDQMLRLAGEQWRLKNVSEATKSFEGKTVCITFDDGCETDLRCAAPVLRELRAGATFYLTIDFLERPGYLSHSQVRELSAQGFEIGCHSLTHPYLPDVEDHRLREETAGAKDRLEQIAGVAVEHLSCPGGRWDRRVLEAVKAANFRTMATSRTGANSANASPFSLARVAVLSDTSVDSLMRTCRGQGLFQARLKETARDAAKRLLGNSVYDSLRGLVLGNKPDTHRDVH